MADTEFKPYKRNDGSFLIDGISANATHVTDKQYADVRKGFETARNSATPDQRQLLDKYLDQTKSGKMTLTAQELGAIDKTLEKGGLSRGPLTSAVGSDLKSHGYSSSYKPALLIEVNGRPMSASLVMDELKSRGVHVTGEIPTSNGPGKFTGGNITVDTKSLAQAGHATETARGGSQLGANKANVFAQVIEHSGGISKILKALPVIGQVAKIGGAVAAMAGSVQAFAQEPSLKNAAGVAVAAADLADPTGFAVGTVRDGLPLAVEDIKGNIKSGGIANSRVKTNLAITESQKFLFSPDHPGQLGALKIELNGKPLNVAEALKSPSGQRLVMDEISRREAATASPEMKEQFKEMRSVAQEFIDLEARKRPTVSTPTRVAENNAPAISSPSAMTMS